MLILLLAWRSLWRNRRRTLLTMSSIAAGVVLIAWTESIVAGSHNTMIDKATRLMAGHVTVEHRGYNDTPGPDLMVPSVAAVIEAGRGIPGLVRPKVLALAQAVASTGGGSVAVRLVGVDPGLEALGSPLAAALVEGRYLHGDDERGIYIGMKLAERLNLAIGKKLVVTTTDSNGDLSADLLRVVGIFRTGADDLDLSLVQVPLVAARRVLRMESDQASAVGFLLREPELQRQALSMLRTRLDSRDLEVLPWESVMPELANWVELFRVLSQSMVWLMLVLVGFNILNTVLMSVLERRREFATQLALGVSPRMLRLQILLETAFLGMLGCGLGSAAGTAACWWGSRYGLDLSRFLDGLQIAGFPLDMMVYNRVSPLAVARLAAVVLVATVVIGLYPTYRAAHVHVADNLRTH